MSHPEIPRPDLAGQLLAAAARRGPLLLAGPPGAGKTTLLLGAARALAAQGWRPVYLDLMAAASSPERFVTAALERLSAESFGRRLPQAIEIRRLVDSGRRNAADAVERLFALWASLSESGGRPVALLLDEATEIRSLAYFAGLREVHEPFIRTLSARPRGTLLATSFPSQARKLWPRVETLDARPLGSEDVAGAARSVGVDPGALSRASFGWPRYVSALLEAVKVDGDLIAAWAREMAPGGRLEAACRHTYESLLLRSRGYGMSKAVLSAVAEEEGLNLTALVPRLGRTPGAVRDYLGWLLGVDALRQTKKRYYFVDGMVRLWVRLHARGAPPSIARIEETARETVGRAAPAEPTAEAKPAASAPARHDSLMEID